LTSSTFYTGAPQTLGTTAQNLVETEAEHTGFVDLCFDSSQELRYSLAQLGLCSTVVTTSD